MLKPILITSLLCTVCALAGCSNQGPILQPQQNTCETYRDIVVGDTVYVFYGTGIQVGEISSVLLYRDNDRGYRVCFDEGYRDCEYFEIVFKTKQDIIDMASSLSLPPSSSNE